MAVLDGYLVKRGLRFKSWKKRYFTFYNGVLSYSKHHGQGAKILKRGEVVNVLYWSGRKHGLCVHLGCGRALYIQASSDAEANRWYNVFEDYVNRKRTTDDLLRVLGQQPHLEPILE